MRFWIASSVFVVIAFVSLVSEIRAQEQILVTTNSDEDDGSLDPTAGRGTSLREAINHGSEGAVITFRRFSEMSTIVLDHADGQLVVDKSLTVDSTSIPNGTTLDAQRRGRIMMISSGVTVDLRGLTFENGEAHDGGFQILNGGAIFSENATLALSDCNFSRNFAGLGGGVFFFGREGDATLSLSRCGFSENHGALGGGISINSYNGDVTVSLSECTFTNNLSDSGGGLHSAARLGGNTILSLSECLFSRNDGGFFGGGGIFHESSEGNTSMSLVNCKFIENRGDDGGGIFSLSSGGSATLSLTGCVLSGNLASYGGGIFSDGSEGFSELMLDGCTLSGNRALDGAGIFSGGDIFSPGSVGSSTLEMSDCTVSGNLARSWGGGIFRNARNGGSSPMDLVACTISNNSARSGGGIFGIGDPEDIPGSLTDCILAGNRAPSFGPDIAEQDSALILKGSNVIGNVYGSGSGPDPDSGFATVPGLIGDSANPIDPKLGQLGDYGGTTQTMPPLPGSPALDAASESTRVEDQRGFPVVDTADIGAAEFQGRSDLEFIWDTDYDGDGNSFGVEFALGTDSLVFDADDPGNLTVVGTDVQFGYNPDAVGFAVWKVERSSDLENWTEIFSDVDPGEVSVLSDSTDPSAFYRFVAEEVGEP